MKSPGSKTDNYCDIKLVIFNTPGGHGEPFPFVRARGEGSVQFVRSDKDQEVNMSKCFLMTQLLF